MSDSYIYVYNRGSFFVGVVKSTTMIKFLREKSNVGPRTIAYEDLVSL